MNSDWTVSTISDICTLVTDGAHNSPKSVENGMYMASVKDFTEYGLDFSTCRMISPEDYKKLNLQGCVPETGDILVGKDGARFFEDIIIYRQKEKPALLSSIAILRPDIKKVIPEFLYYTLKTPAFKKDIRENYGSGSAIPRIVLKDFKRMPIAYPIIDEQKRIVSTCVSIDKKIQLNNRINENLLQQAQVLYNEICRNASLSRLDCLITTIETGSRPKGGAMSDGIPSIGAEKIECFGIYDYNSEKYISEEYFSKLKRGIVQSGDVLLYKDGAYTGKSTMALDGFPHEKCAVNEHVFILRSEHKKAQSFLYCTLSSPPIREQIHTLACGKAAQPGLNQQELSCVEVPMPSIEAISRFEEVVDPLMHLIALNAKANRYLAQLRDSLLPKLMSGELDVSELDL